MATQNGYVFRKGKSWFIRYRDGGKQRCKKLADVCDRYRREKDVQPLAAEFLAPFNAGKVRPESHMMLLDFATEQWLPWAEKNCKPSTVYGYRTFWKLYLGPHMPKVSLRDFHTSDACNLFSEIYRKHHVGRRVLRNAKGILRSIFALAKTWGAFDGANPIVDARLPMEAPVSIATHAATPDEVLTIMDILAKAGETKVRAAVALIFFSGLRPGEARGALWQDYDGKRLLVRQSVWHGHTTMPKTADAAAPVPIIPMLADILAGLRELDGNPTEGPILRGLAGRPLVLDNVSKRILMPALRRCVVCDEQENRHKAAHPFKLDESVPQWHGWYSLRRGVATTLASLTKDGMASKGLLRHTNIATTMRYYVKDVPANTQAGMDMLENLCNHSATDSNARPN
jgi:integrase